jgi:hypothetical protein
MGFIFPVTHGDALVPCKASKPLTDLQSEILTLLGVPRQAYRPPA